MEKIISKIKNILLFINTKHLIISIIILFFSVLFISFSYFPTLNFFAIFKNLITNNIYILSLIITIIFLIISIYNSFNNYLVILRYENFNLFLDKVFNIIKFYIFFLITISIIFITVISIIRSDFNFLLIKDNVYDISIIIYLIFYTFRLYVLIYLLMKLVYYLQVVFNNKIMIVVYFLLIFLNFLSFNSYVDKIYKIPLLITEYFKEISYCNYYLEISGSILQCLILLFFINLINIFIKNREDVKNIFFKTV